MFRTALTRLVLTQAYQSVRMSTRASTRTAPVQAQALSSLANVMHKTEEAVEAFVHAARPEADESARSSPELTPPPSSPLSGDGPALSTPASPLSTATTAADEAEDAEADAKPKTTPRKTRAKKEPELDADGKPIKTPRKPRAKKEPELDEDGKPIPKKPRAKKEPEYDADGNVIKKKRVMKPKPPIVYVIPEVERKTTTFKGRLGYACLNTVLRGTKPDSIFCSRTCRIASIEKDGRQIMAELALKNVKDLKVMIQWNEDNKIRFMRMSSEMFPFASHKIYGYDLSFADKELKEAGDLAKSYGHRLTMHPGQFTQLGSPKDAVVEASIRELEYQCEIMDRMGLDQDGVMIIHMGGVYGDKPTTLARFKDNYVNRVPDRIKRRLVLENDEICYNVDDIMPVCNELEIPIIFDYHHDWINPSSRPPAELIPLIAETWKKRGIKMKQHLSEPRPGAVSVMERRAHSDRCQTLPDCLPDDVDLMIEAKDKEQAVFELYRIYGLEDVIHDNLRPPNENPSMHTNGRKSSLKKKVKPTGDVDEDGTPIELDDVEKEGDGELGDEGLSMHGQESAPGTPKASPTPKKRARAPAKAKVKEEVGDEGLVKLEEDGEEEPPKKKGRKTAEKTEAAKPAPKKRGPPAKPKAATVENAASEGAETNAVAVEKSEEIKTE